MPQEYDLPRMQEEAARRAREMQARARIPIPRPTPRPPEPPAPPPEPTPPPPPLLPAKPEQPLDALFQDRERTIILALLVLLSGEEENHELLFALMFLLM